MTHRDGFPRLSGCVAHGYRCPASLRHALRAESLGTPSLWVINKDLWYKISDGRKVAVIAANRQ